ncbi:MAG: hypothetical protein ACD_20C00196G0006 [uncultured bacterium]|nr:MAG: hypothetical protein ACD_20C00196G0006 [uncultured bacterium]
MPIKIIAFKNKILEENFINFLFLHVKLNVKKVDSIIKLFYYY